MFKLYKGVFSLTMERHEKVIDPIYSTSWTLDELNGISPIPHFHAEMKNEMLIFV